MGGYKIMITYDKKLVYLANEISGFYFCVELEDCDTGVFLNNWKEISMEHVEQVSSREILITLEEDQSFWLSYLWRETPVLTYLGLPIYEADELSLPSPPWK